MKCMATLIGRRIYDFPTNQYITSIGIKSDQATSIVVVGPKHNRKSFAYHVKYSRKYLRGSQSIFLNIIPSLVF